MDHDELMAMATKTICELNTLTDAQAQELQSAREEIERLTFDSAESMRQYNTQQKRACEAETDVATLREALGPFSDMCRTIEEEGWGTPPRKVLVFWAWLEQAAAALEAE